MSHVCHCSVPGCTAHTTTPYTDGWSVSPAAERGGKPRYQCAYHARVVLGYSHENDVRRGIRETGFTDSTEFEVNNPTPEFRSALMHYQWVPTSDITVDCEFKSPIYEGYRWHKLLNTIEQLIAEGHAEVGDNCGTHHHVGHCDAINHQTMAWVANYYHELFDELSGYLVEHPAECAAVFGRSLGGWADDCRYRSAYEHRNFINVEHAFTLEFRACKFVSAAQYKHVMKLCQGITEAVINRFILNYEGATHEVRCRKAAAVSKHLVKLFKRFYEQRPR